MNSIDWPASSVWVFIAQPGRVCVTEVFLAADDQDGKGLQLDSGAPNEKK